MNILPKTTHTSAILELSQESFAEIRAKLLAAGYEHAFYREYNRVIIDMNGLAIKTEEKKVFKNKDHENYMEGKQISNLTFILRVLALEGVIFDLKEVLKTYANNNHPALGTFAAKNILEKYNKSWDEIYKDAGCE